MPSCMAVAGRSVALAALAAAVVEGAAGDLGCSVGGERCARDSSLLQHGHNLQKSQARSLEVEQRAEQSADGGRENRSAAACCQDFGSWPSVDAGVTCGGCKALVLARPYGGRCDRYCASFGHVCVAAEEELHDSCRVKERVSCSAHIAHTSDMLCTCRLPNAEPSCAAGRVPRPPAGRPPSGGRVEIRGRQVLVGGRAIHLKGVCWNPAPRGARSADFRRAVDRDSELMAAAGINAVRTYGAITDREVLDKLHAKGIWVINSVYNNGGGSPRRVVRKVAAVKDHPAILMWSVGNEWNYNGLYRKWSISRSMARVKEVARIIKSIDNTHPVASIYGGAPSRRVINGLPEIDAWGMNVYSGLGFGSSIHKFARRSGKPLFLGEYGADAWNANLGREDQDAQAHATRVLTEAIAQQSSLHNGPLLGGFLFEFSDEWWKDGHGSKSIHDTGGVAPGGGPHPDRTFNEEWWGIVEVDRKPRKAYAALAKVKLPVA